MSLKKLQEHPLTIGIGLPLDNDMALGKQQDRISRGQSFGIPDMENQLELVQLIDTLGFNTVWQRDVPIYDPKFGDAGQLFETMTYLGYLAGQTKQILLGTAAVILPLREPWLVKKAAQTTQVLSNNRLLLGVASGDRPVEFPLFEKPFENRGEVFRKHVDILRGKKDEILDVHNLDVLPKAPNPPLLVAGLAQQNPEWIGKNMDGWLAYPGPPSDHANRVKLWRNVAGNKPYISFLGINLLEDKNAPIVRQRFDIKTGVYGLIQELNDLRDAGVNHIGLNLWVNERPIKETLHQIAEDVLPIFHNKT